MSWARVVLLCVAGCGRIGFEDPDPGIATVDATQAALDPDLALWFPMDSAPINGKLDSAVPNGQVGRCVAACPVVIPGVRGGAFEFDGLGTALRVPLSGFNSQAGTLSLWARLDVMPPSYMTFLGKPFGTGVQDSLELFLDPFAAAPRLTLLVGGDAVVDSYHELTYPRPLGTWLHFALTWSAATSQLALYLDGKLHATRTFTTGVDNNDLMIGADVNNGVIDNWLRGALDDVRIYRRTLTAAEVAVLATR